jgi:cell wall assembly regulator SMI1
MLPGRLGCSGVKQLGAHLAARGLLGRTAIAKNWRVFLNITLRAMPYLTDSRHRPLKWREAVAGHIQGVSVARKADLSIRVPKKAKVAIDKAAGHGYCPTESLVERILLDCALASNAGRPRQSLTPASALLNPPASEQMLADLAAHLGLALPDQLKAMLLTSNGCPPGSYSLPMRATEPMRWRLLSTGEITAQWDLLCLIDIEAPFDGAIRTVGPVQAGWWCRSWIPIAECGIGDVICLDMNPAPGGTIGQLILYEHDFAERKVLASALLDWIRECADDLERGMPEKLAALP